MSKFYDINMVDFTAERPVFLPKTICAETSIDELEVVVDNGRFYLHINGREIISTVLTDGYVKLTKQQGK